MRASAAFQAWSKSVRDDKRTSLLGKTRIPLPETNPEYESLTNSRNTRFARLRLTAFPNRLPTTIPTRLAVWSILQARRLKSAVEIRRP